MSDSIRDNINKASEMAKNTVSSNENIGLKALSDPLIKYLKGHPHKTIIINSSSAEVLVGIEAVSNEEFIKG